MSEDSLGAGSPDLLLLTFHVTYWNYLGWRDPYSLDAATQRQRRYVALGVKSRSLHAGPDRGRQARRSRVGCSGG